MVFIAACTPSRRPSSCLKKAKAYLWAVTNTQAQALDWWRHPTSSKPRRRAKKEKRRERNVELNPFIIV